MEMKRIVLLPVLPTMELNKLKLKQNIFEWKKCFFSFFKFRLRITPENTFAAKLRYLISNGGGGG